MAESPPRKVEDLAKASDLGIETGTAFLQGIVDTNARTHLQRRERRSSGADRCTGHGQHNIHTNGAQQRALA